MAARKYFLLQPDGAVQAFRKLLYRLQFADDTASERRAEREPSLGREVVLKLAALSSLAQSRLSGAVR